MDSLRYTLADASEGVGDVCIISYILGRRNVAAREGLYVRSQLYPSCTSPQRRRRV